MNMNRLSLLLTAGAVALAAAVLSPVPKTLAAPPLLEKMDLFESGRDGYALYRIPGIVVTQKGTVLAWCEARRTGKGDWGPIDVMMRRSSDGGKTWSPRRCIVQIEGELPVNPVAAAQKLDRPGDNTANNPVAIADRQTGAVHFLYCLEYMRCFTMRSDDDGATWSKPVEITATFEQFRKDYDWKVIATGPGHGIQLAHGPHKGRLLVPVWMSLGTGNHAHRPSVASTIYSDDHGKTWQRGEIAIPDEPPYRYPSETAAVQLVDGRVLLNARSESDAHRRIQTISKDGATGWSKPAFNDALLEPICLGSIIRFSRKPESDKNRVLFANPHNLQRADRKAKEGLSRDRRNLSIKLSYDEGKTWPVDKPLEPGFSAYSDMAVLDDGTVLCFFERGREADAERKKPTSYAYLTLARFNVEWLTDGKDVPVLDQRNVGVEPVVPSPPRDVLDVSLEPPVVITAPGAEFQNDARPGAMIIGMDRTPKGRIWGCWTGTGDKPDTYFILASSDDGGVTWSKPRLVVGAADPSGKPQRRALVGNVWTDPRGRVWLFFDQSLVGFDGRAGDWYIRCDNPDAVEPVWSKPVRIADGCTLNKPTVLKNGDWLLPVSLWTREKINPAMFREAHHDLDPMRMANVFASADQGKTWTRRGGVAFPQTDFDEHMIVELRNGRLWMLARTKYGMAETFSSDSGRTWTEPKPAAIQNVSARFFIRRLASGRLLLVKNGPIDHRLPKRSHMSAFLSDDDGKTWRGGLLLDERASVSYPDGFQAPDGLVHILYDWNRHTDAEILMAKFREEDVLAGKFISPDARPRILVNKALGPKPRAARVRVPSLGSNSKSSVSLFLGGLPWRRPSTSRSLRSSASPRTTCCGTAGEAKAVALELACRLAHGMRCNDAAEDRVSMNSREPSNDRNSFHGRCPPYADWSSRAVQRHL